MSLSIRDKKCTLDYLGELVPIQRKWLAPILGGKVQSVESQVETIQYTIKFVAEGKERYDYDSILRVFNSWINQGKGNIRLDRLQEELRNSFII